MPFAFRAEDEARDGRDADRVEKGARGGDRVGAERGRNPGKEVQGRPWRFSEDTLDAPGVPAFRGEHNVEVFAELGLSRQEIQRSIDAGMLIEHQHQAPLTASPQAAAPAAAGNEVALQ